MVGGALVGFDARGADDLSEARNVAVFDGPQEWHIEQGLVGVDGLCASLEKSGVDSAFAKAGRTPNQYIVLVLTGAVDNSVRRRPKNRIYP